MNYIRDCQFGNLAVDGAGDVGHLQHLGGQVAGRGAGADLDLDSVDQVFIQDKAGAQDDEQDDAGIVVPLLADHQSF